MKKAGIGGVKNDQNEWIGGVKMEDSVIPAFRWVEAYLRDQKVLQREDKGGEKADVLENRERTWVMHNFPPADDGTKAAILDLADKLKASYPENEEEPKVNLTVLSADGGGATEESAP